MSEHLEDPGFIAFVINPQIESLMAQNATLCLECKSCCGELPGAGGVDFHTVRKLMSLAFDAGKEEDRRAQERISERAHKIEIEADLAGLDTPLFQEFDDPNATHWCCGHEKAKGTTRCWGCGYDPVYNDEQPSLDDERWPHCGHPKQDEDRCRVCGWKS